MELQKTKEEEKEFIPCKECKFYYRQSLLAEAHCFKMFRDIDDNDTCRHAQRKKCTT